jgi:archaellum component FlaC
MASNARTAPTLDHIEDSAELRQVQTSIGHVSAQIAGVGHQVAGVSGQVAGVSGQVAGVAGQLSSVDRNVSAACREVSAATDKIQVMDGALQQINVRTGTIQEGLQKIPSVIESATSRLGSLLHESTRVQGEMLGVIRSAQLAEERERAAVELIFQIERALGHLADPVARYVAGRYYRGALNAAAISTATFSSFDGKEHFDRAVGHLAAVTDLAPASIAMEADDLVRVVRAESQLETLRDLFLRQDDAYHQAIVRHDLEYRYYVEEQRHVADAITTITTEGEGSLLTRRWRSMPRTSAHYLLGLGIFFAAVTLLCLGVGAQDPSTEGDFLMCALPSGFAAAGLFAASRYWYRRAARPISVLLEEHGRKLEKLSGQLLRINENVRREFTQTLEQERLALQNVGVGSGPEIQDLGALLARLDEGLTSERKQLDRHRATHPEVFAYDLWLKSMA